MMRRRYFSGNCQDCGHSKRVTRVFFWVNGMPYVVCAECIKPYRTKILTNVTRQGEAKLMSDWAKKEGR